MANLYGIPLHLWLADPAQALRAMQHMARTGETNVNQALSTTSQRIAAKDLLELAMPGRKHARRRRMVTKRLWSGALDPAALVDIVRTHEANPEMIFRAALRAVIDGDRPAPDPGAPTA